MKIYGVFFDHNGDLKCEEANVIKETKKIYTVDNELTFYGFRKTIKKSEVCLTHEEALTEMGKSYKSWVKYLIKKLEKAAKRLDRINEAIVKFER